MAVPYHAYLEDRQNQLQNRLSRAGAQVKGFEPHGKGMKDLNVFAGHDAIKVLVQVTALNRFDEN